MNEPFLYSVVDIEALCKKVTVDAEARITAYWRIEDSLQTEIKRLDKQVEELKTLLKAAREDVGRIDWIESKMKMDNDYCEIYFAGLRDFSGQASAYQVESNPQIFTTTTGQTLREAIDKAGKINVVEIRHDHWIP